jgi:hypothetical protein
MSAHATVTRDRGAGSLATSQPLMLGRESIVENVYGAASGTITIVEPDAIGPFLFTVSDPRFEVVDEVLRLKPDQRLSRSAEPTVDLTITATSEDASQEQLEQTFSIGVIQNEFPWHNSINAWDSNGDGETSPSDALGIINDLNSLGARDLLSQPFDRQPAIPFPDTNSDNNVTSADVLLVINHLNQSNREEGEAAELGAINLLAIRLDSGLSTETPKPRPLPRTVATDQALESFMDAPSEADLNPRRGHDDDHLTISADQHDEALEDVLDELLGSGLQ